MWRLLRTKAKRAPPLPNDGARWTLPAEESQHTATWLQWPHNYGWDKHHVQRLEHIWIAMTVALHKGERVNIIAYNEKEKDRIATLLQSRQVDLSQIDLFCMPTDDVWIRDSGPIFVYNQENGSLTVTDWRFNGWGGKAAYKKCNQIPGRVAEQLHLPICSIPMVNEGGSIEIDGRGTLMAKRSSILNKNRNPGWTQDDAETYFSKYLGVSNFIWLQGKERKGDITDDHIDGTARFANGNSIVTFYPQDNDIPGEYHAITNAKDVNGNSYQIVHLPVTSQKIPQLGDYGIYTNYYVGNKVVLLPTYNDPNDTLAEQVLAKLYPTRTIVSIDSVELFKDGGILHCVTQQQPAPK